MPQLDFIKLASLWAYSHLTRSKQHDTTNNVLTDTIAASCPDVLLAFNLNPTCLLCALAPSYLAKLRLT
jgi:hypothetical protein